MGFIKMLKFSEWLNNKDRPKLLGMYFYGVMPQDEDRARAIGLERHKRGILTWAIKVYDTSGSATDRRIEAANRYFGKGKWWGVQEY